MQTIKLSSSASPRKRRPLLQENVPPDSASSSVSPKKRRPLQPLSDNNNNLLSPTSSAPVDPHVLHLKRNLHPLNFNKSSLNHAKQSACNLVNKTSPSVLQSTSGQVTSQVVSRSSLSVQQPLSSLVNTTGTGPVITKSNKSGHASKIIVSRSQVVGHKSASNLVNSQTIITRPVPVIIKQSAPAAILVLPQDDLNYGSSPNNFKQRETNRPFPNTVQVEYIRRLSSRAILYFYTNVEEISKDTLSPNCRALIPARKSLSLKKSTNVSTTSTEENQSDLFNKRLQEDLMASLPSNNDHHIVPVNALQPYHKQPDLDQRSMFSAIKDFCCNHNTLAQYRETKTEAYKKHTVCDAYICTTVKNFNMERQEQR
ncbi:GDSL esterase/lipase 6 [Frankliniella fusca]|uniref:GDSL esterase/lipase 6 n=1 Tax=Frankliniella fusca TaxID=407009 RepID=A0AAE1LYJ9_9NEOP|nr:GDSL esterase/lipase 6 [Frankliniella fusca]